MISKLQLNSSINDIRLSTGKGTFLLHTLAKGSFAGVSVLIDNLPGKQWEVKAVALNPALFSLLDKGLVLVNFDGSPSASEDFKSVRQRVMGDPLANEFPSNVCLLSPSVPLLMLSDNETFDSSWCSSFVQKSM